MCIKATLGSLELLILHLGAHQVTADPALLVTSGDSEPFDVISLKEPAELVVTNEEGELIALCVINSLSQLKQIRFWNPSYNFYLEKRTIEFGKLINYYSR